MLATDNTLPQLPHSFIRSLAPLSFFSFRAASHMPSIVTFRYLPSALPTASASFPPILSARTTPFMILSDHFFLHTPQIVPSKHSLFSITLCICFSCIFQTRFSTSLMPTHQPLHHSNIPLRSFCMCSSLIPLTLLTLPFI